MTIDSIVYQNMQHLIEKNKAAPGRIHGKDEYLLTTKLYCGECDTPMTGYGGTSKSGKHYHYYMCNNAKKHKCDKKNGSQGTDGRRCFGCMHEFAYRRANQVYC